MLKHQIDAVVIGASAGGIEALNQILPRLPASLPVPVFVVVHLPREQKSLLAEIFVQRCALRVVEAEDKESIEKGTIYFAPPDYHLLINSRNELSLSVDDLVNFSRPSIDVLFESAAEVYQESLMGIVLTGANTDGATGMATIARHGGVAVVQRPDTAVSSTMIDAALASTPKSMVLDLPGIAQLMMSIDRPRFETERVVPVRLS